MNKYLERIKKWFICHKPLNFEFIVIIILLLALFRKFFLFSLFFIIGIISYPNKVDYVPIFEKAGERIGEIYANLMSTLYERGYHLGGVIDPYNVAFTTVLLWILKLAMIGFCIWLIVWAINTYVYSGSFKSRCFVCRKQLRDKSGVCSNCGKITIREYFKMKLKKK